MFAFDVLKMRKPVAAGQIVREAFQASAAGETTTAGGALNGYSINGMACAVGDVLVVAVSTSDATTNLAAPSCSGNQTGAFTAARADVYGDDTLDVNLWVFVQRLTGLDQSLSFTGLPASSDVSIQVIRYSGVHATTQLDVALPTPTTGINGDLANPPAITPVTAGAKIVAIYAAAQSSSTAWTAPSGMSNFQQSFTSLPVTRLGTADANWTSGAFDPAAVTGGNANAQNSWAAVTLALRPA